MVPSESIVSAFPLGQKTLGVKISKNTTYKKDHNHKRIPIANTQA
jgi:hypothetical protein